MKHFNFIIYDNFKGIPGEFGMALFNLKHRKIGIQNKKELLLDRFGIRNTLTIWLWKWVFGYAWISKE